MYTLRNFRWGLGESCLLRSLTGLKIVRTLVESIFELMVSKSNRTRKGTEQSKAHQKKRESEKSKSGPSSVRQVTQPQLLRTPTSCVCPCSPARGLTHKLLIIPCSANHSGKSFLLPKMKVSQKQTNNNNKKPVDQIYKISDSICLGFPYKKLVLLSSSPPSHMPVRAQLL